MKVVTIWQTYGPYHLARVQALQELFRDNTVVCLSHCDEDSVTYPFFNLTPPIHEVISPGEATDIVFSKAIWRTYRILRRHSPDLVLTCGYERPETLGAEIFGLLYRKPVFLMLDNQYADRPRNVLVEWIKRIYLRLFDGFIYGGDTHENYLRVLRVPVGREVYGYNCVDNDLINQLANKFRTEGDRELEGTNYFLCVARFIEKKNLPRLISAYADYKSKIKKDEAWKLVLVGDGPERSKIEREIERFGLQHHVKLAGRVDDFEQVIRWLAFAKALILPSSHNEQWGLVVNEAMAANRPVIVSKQCGCASSLVKEGENGFTFDPFEPELLAKHMVWMHVNETKLDEMGRRSFEIVQQYSPESFARNVQWLYQKVSRNTSK